MEYSDLYLGLDLSLSSTGIAVVEVRNRKPRLVISKRIKTNARQRHGERLYTIANELRELRRIYGFKQVIRERGFSNHRITTTQTLFKVIGVSDLLYRDYEIAEYPPKTVKKRIAGDGNAEKGEVERGVREILELPDDYCFDSDDASDAVAVILTYLLEKNLIDVKKRGG